MSMSERVPWPRPARTPKPAAAPAPAAARMIFRLKDSAADGNLYQGTTLIKRCSNCRKP